MTTRWARRVLLNLVAPKGPPHPIGCTGREDFHLDLAVEQIVDTLLHDETEEVATFGQFIRTRNVPARKVSAPDIEHLAFAHQLLHGLPDLLPGRGAVNPMHQIKVNIIGSKTPQAI